MLLNINSEEGLGFSQSLFMVFGGLRRLFRLFADGEWATELFLGLLRVVNPVLAGVWKLNVFDACLID